MILEEIKELLTGMFGEETVLGTENNGFQPSLIIAPDKIAEVCLDLRDNPSSYFDFLACLTGVDYGKDSNRFGVVYHLASIPYQTQITLKISKENSRDLNQLPEFKSISAVYKTAEWHEREAYDLIGIYFENHPDLRRILLPDDWEGYPLRKDYANAEFYKGIKID